MVVGAHQMIGRRFRRRVGTVRRVWRVLAKGRVFGPQRTVDFVGGDVEETESFSIGLRKCSPVRAGFFEKSKCSVDIGADEIFRAANGTVYVALRSEMHNGCGPVCFQESSNQSAIANVAVNKLVSRIGRDALDIV